MQHFEGFEFFTEASFVCCFDLVAVGMSCMALFEMQEVFLGTITFGGLLQAPQASSWPAPPLCLSLSSPSDVLAWVRLRLLFTGVREGRPHLLGAEQRMMGRVEEEEEEEEGLWLPVRCAKQERQGFLFLLSSSTCRAEFLCTCVNTVQEDGGGTAPGFLYQTSSVLQDRT